ncbi:ORF1 [Grizzly bear anellovirus 7]|nr:ORF1 [Grizzly bear anellovirus 7]
MPWIRRRRRRRRLPRRRYLFRYRRWRRPWWRRYRRRRYRHQTVRNTRPKIIKWLHVKGVEFLGVLGSEVQMTYSEGQSQNEGKWEISIRNIALVNKEVSYWQKVFPPGLENVCGETFGTSELNFWDFTGGFGQAHFTLEGLILRILFGLAKVNITLQDFQYIKFVGFRFTPQRAPTLSYLFLAEDHRQEKDWEKGLLHPVNLLNTPGTITVNSVNRTHCCRNPSVKKRADPTIFGWSDIEDFMKRPLASYAWTYFNPGNPLGRNNQITSKLKSPIDNSWMRDHQGKKLSEYCPNWSDRARWDANFVTKINEIQGLTSSDKNDFNWWDLVKDWTIQSGDQLKCDYGKHSPFLPPVAVANTPETFWMRYDFWFQLGGRSIGYKRQPWPVKEADVCFPCPQAQRDGFCDTCIDPEKDLDIHGLIRKKAFQRIISSDNARRKRALAKLAKLIHLRNSKRKKRVSWSDEARPRGSLHLSI